MHKPARQVSIQLDCSRWEKSCTCTILPTVRLRSRDEPRLRQASLMSRHSVELWTCNGNFSRLLKNQMAMRVIAFSFIRVKSESGTHLPTWRTASVKLVTRVREWVLLKAFIYKKLKYIDLSKGRAQKKAQESKNLYINGQTKKKLNM